MSALQTNFRDSDYHAFADGLMSPQRRSEMIAFLATHPQETGKVLGWQRQNSLIRAAFVAKVAGDEGRLASRPTQAAGVPGVNVPAGMQGQASALAGAGRARLTVAAQPAALAQARAPLAGVRNVRRKNAGAMVAAAGMCLAGVTIILAAVHFATFTPDFGRPGWVPRAAAMVSGELAGSQTDGLLHRASEAHAVFAEDSDVPVEFDGAATAKLSAYLTRRTGATVRAPNLTQQGLRLLGARILPLPDGVAAMLVYEGSGGRRLGLSIAQFAVAGDAGLQFHYAESGAVHAVRAGRPRRTLRPGQDRRRRD